MLVKTRGIVLNSIKFKETSLIVKIYTEKFGLQSYMVNGVRTKKPKLPSAFFQPLTLLDMVVYHKENRSLKRIAEAKCFPSFHTIPFEHKKSCLSLFLSEILLKTLKEETADETLFEFLAHTILVLDHEKVSSDFHLQFLIKLSFFLGFGPSSSEDIVWEMEERKILEDLLDSEMNTAVINTNTMRRRILENILKFYGKYMEGFGEVRSLKVLNEVFN